ncbi:MAG TPA: hypothetical protein VH477_14910 [Bryobacteraceae bacterium]|jgi:hypothetical protein
MNDEIALKRALKELAESLPHEATAQSEARLVAAFRRHRFRIRMSWLAAAAAVLVLAVSSAFLARRPHPAPPARAINSFIPLPYGQSDVPLEHGVIVRVQVQSGAGPVDADLLIGQDGLARAVRFTE